MAKVMIEPIDWLSTKKNIESVLCDIVVVPEAEVGVNTKKLPSIDYLVPLKKELLIFIFRWLKN